MNASPSADAVAGTTTFALLLCLISIASIANAAVDGNRIHVKLAPDADPGALATLGTPSPLFTLPIKRLRKLCRASPGLPDLTLWYGVSVDPSIDVGSFVGGDEVNSSVVTDVVVPQSYPPPAIVNTSTPDLVAGQGYLRNATDGNGMGAEYSWTFPGGDGTGITIYDVEYAWNQNHEDLTATAGGVHPLLDDGDASVNPFLDSGMRDDAIKHGTAVLGAMVGDPDNGAGVKGASHGADVGLAPERTRLLGSARANAILLAVDDGKPGDVILLEMQAVACGLGDASYGPAEDDLDVYEATKVAIANGFVVVASAGNGQVDLDDPLCEGKYDRDLRDSGAILVGAGGSGSPGCSEARTRLDFSTYGDRLDVQGWGECIATTSYGDGDNYSADPSDGNRRYTMTFGGTSGAAALVAAAAANVQGAATGRFGVPLHPLAVRQLLSDTGAPQAGDVDRRIGPLVDLGRAIDALVALASSFPGFDCTSFHCFCRDLVRVFYVSQQNPHSRRRRPTSFPPQRTAFSPSSGRIANAVEAIGRPASPFGPGTVGAALPRRTVGAALPRWMVGVGAALPRAVGAAVDPNRANPANPPSRERDRSRALPHLGPLLPRTTWDSALA